MKFTKKTDYALRAMQFLARRYYRLGELEGSGPGSGPVPASGSPASGASGPVPVQFISEASHLSLRFLHGIVSKLSKAGLLKTIPGARGGIALARNPGEITLLDIIEAVEGKINLMDCMEHPHHCSDFQQCSIMGVLHTAQAALVNTLSNTTLKLMVKAKHDPFNHLPEKHFLKPQFGCPVLK